MSELFDNYHERMYQNQKESDHSLLYIPPPKRPRIVAPFVFTSRVSSIEVLPEECIYEIFRRLARGQERSNCACVSKRWLMLLGSIHRNDMFNIEETDSLVSDNRLECDKKDGVFDCDEIETRVLVNEGFLSRNLIGKKATDTRLVALAIGTASQGGLGKLSIFGSNSVRGVTNFGLKAVANSCPSLRVLSIWKLLKIDDVALINIANGCPLLKKLYLSHCPNISDKGLIEIVKKCPNLSSIVIESCRQIGNPSLQAVGNYCRKLTILTVKNCVSVHDKGIVSLLSPSVGVSLSKLKLEGLNVGDMALAVIGNFGRSLTHVSLVRLGTARGFGIMGNICGLRKLRSLVIASCGGVNDVGLEAIGKGCPSLKQFSLKKCSLFTDKGMFSFTESAVSLVKLRLEECCGITRVSVFGRKLKAIALVNCIGLKDVNCNPNCLSPLRSLVIRNCPRFNDASLSAVGQTCLQLQHVVLSGLQGITDIGIETLVNANKPGFVKLNISDCVNLTDKSVNLIADIHGSTLEELNLEGCGYLTDDNLKAIAENCPLLTELDVSRSGITDSGIAILAREEKLVLLTLSVAGCSRVSKECFPFLVELGRYLLSLNIQHCKGISSMAVDDLIEKLFRCDIIY